MQYDNKTVKNYDKFYSKKDYASEVDFIDKIVRGVSGKNIIDIGCGTGTHSILMSTKGASFVKGIDISDHMIEAASYKSSEISYFCVLSCTFIIPVLLCTFMYNYVLL